MTDSIKERAGWNGVLVVSVPNVPPVALQGIADHIREELAAFSDVRVEVRYVNATDSPAKGDTSTPAPVGDIPGSSGT